jgi:hypothetical protein
MKKVLIAAAALFTVTIANAGSHTGKNDYKNLVPGFSQDFIGAENVEWSSDGDFHYAHFVQNGNYVTALYDKLSSAYMGYFKITDADHLPSYVRMLLKKDFSSYTAFGTAAEIDTPENNAYIVTIENNKQILKVKIDNQGNSSVLSRLKKVS